MTQVLTRHIVLIGMMGAGKTAIGSELARRLRVPFTDSDAEIEAAAAMSISEIFARDGEAFFRAREVCSLIARLAEVETSVYRLAVHIRKTLRRVNALEKVVIPDLRADMARIAGALEEAEREDFVRMKTAQKLLRKKEAKRKQ